MIFFSIYPIDNGYAAHLKAEYASHITCMNKVLPTQKQCLDEVEKTLRIAIIERLHKYLNHREYILRHTLALTPTTLGYIDNLRKRITANGTTLYNLCTVVVQVKGRLYEILPKSNSKYYSHDVGVISAVVADCKQLLEQMMQNENTEIVNNINGNN